MEAATPLLPALPLDAWEATKTTLHLYLQIVGKIQLALNPKRNHWWHITLLVSPKGISSQPIPFAEGHMLEIHFNFRRHRVELCASTGHYDEIPLQHGLSVARFYALLFDKLEQMGVEAPIVAKPFDVPGITAPFSHLEEHFTYQPLWVERFWQILRWTDGVFKEFCGGFSGKTCPVHLYWHHLDLTVTRFSGRSAPPMPAEARQSDKEAYSHEMISFGFWAGDEQVRGAAFYSYTYPSPKGLEQCPLEPHRAEWVISNGSPMALLMYDDLRAEADPRAALLAFLQSCYQAGAKLAGWEEAKVEMAGTP
ncbi:DUF5996 family protein [Cesiribacter andamanensis]|uniref:Ava_C0101 and related proteins n=1 Tax=Cesiribacter andamanensis AMV16 TaxID=1279009 RepID=M7N036_9BACT|nr:DUF5996 family protein [Cesiribacter andamanensis]EMR02053.1 hypothetical protein ADICEAN_02799 [Cesiribacter andamanensis AMV16]